MALGANNTRIPNYSNPDITFGANPTGVAGVSECAEVIDASFCAAANTRPDPYFIVGISGADQMCPPGSGTYNNVYSANIIAGTYYGTPTLGTAPYTISGKQVIILRAHFIHIAQQEQQLPLQILFVNPFLYD